MRQASRRARRVMGRGAEASASNLTESIPKNLKTAQNRPMDIPCNLMAKRPCPHLMESVEMPAPMIHSRVFGYLPRTTQANIKQRRPQCV